MPKPCTCLIHQAVRTLTDAEIQALPTTAPLIVPAPGSGQMHRFISGVIVLDTTAGAYTNVDLQTILYLFYEAQGFSASNNVFASSDALTVAQQTVINLTPIVRGQPENDPQIEDHAPLSAVDGQPLLFGIYNANPGDFTGGHPANTMRIAVTYLTIDLSTGLLV